tara:strand:- start:47 stop:1324 length:1278 start_codon:yes stop_codon:yes gene_type:complete
MIKEKYKVFSIKKELCYDWLLNKHYAKRVPSIIYSFGLFENNILVGVITYGMPPSSTLAISLCGDKYKNIVLELNRLVVNDGLDKNALSFFVSQSINKIPKPKIIVSFSDNNMSHNGYIYQATNFIYTGLTSNCYMFIDKEGQEFHFRNLGHYQKKLNNEINIKKRIINNLSDDLLKKEYKNIKNKNKYFGHCYVASECLYHLSNKDLKVYNIKHENSSHWFLKDKKDNIIDLTSEQFQTLVPYKNARRMFFLTKKPSKRAKILINKVINYNFKIIKRRLNEDKINKIEIANYLRDNKSDWTAKKLDKIFGYKDTAAHWFRKDSGFSFVNVDDWIKLKEILKLDNKHDNIMLDFEWVADVKEIIKKLELKKIEILPKNRYVYISANKNDKKNILNNLKYKSLKYPKNINKRYKNEYKPKVQLQIL